MKALWIATVVAVVAIAFGCGVRGGAAPGAIARSVGGAEAAAVQLLEALKSGDADVLADHLDLKGMYDSMPEAMRGATTFQGWENEIRAMMKKGARPNTEFEYEIISVEEKGDTATVTVKGKETKDGVWEEQEMKLKKIDGTWKLNMQDLMKMGGS